MFHNQCVTSQVEQFSTGKKKSLAIIARPWNEYEEFITKKSVHAGRDLPSGRSPIAPILFVNPFVFFSILPEF
jgi:hypothetical protein